MEYTEVPSRIIVQAQRAARSALVQWYSGQWHRQEENLDDLSNELIVWYMTRKKTRLLMDTLSDPEVMVTFRKHAVQLLSRAVLDGDVFEGKVLYSSESVKDALKGESTNKYLNTIIPLALKKLNSVYREALASRYIDGEFPQTKQEEDAQRRATRRLTDEVNVLYITNEVDSIGSKSVVFPDSIRPKGGYSDPTASTALTLMKTSPSYTDEYLYEPSWEQVCKGSSVEPVIEFGPSGRYRLSSKEAELFRRVPGLIDLFIEQKQKEWHG